jgi:hypothetical protein
VRLRGPKGVSLSREMTLPYGTHQVGWTPPTRGRFRLRIEAQGPSGPVGVKARTFRVVLPKPKPKKKPKPRDAEEPCGPRTTVACQLDQLTPRPEPENVER